MTWFKVDDHLHSHRKAMRAGTEAMGLWVLAGSWSGAEESDGWVPAYVLTRLVGPGGEALAERLVAAGLWHADTVEGEDGFRFHEWETYQPTKAKLEAKRADARDRMARARAQGGDVRANSGGTSRAVTPTPTRPDPTNNTAAGAAEFDAWWEGYPRKVGKAAAAKAYAKARKSATADELMAGLTNACAVWQAARTEERFIPHASTWLNRESWTDQQDPLPAMPQGAVAARPSVTLRQCDGTVDCPGTPHRWSDDRNAYHCQGA